MQRALLLGPGSTSPLTACSPASPANGGGPDLPETRGGHRTADLKKVRTPIFFLQLPSDTLAVKLRGNTSSTTETIIIIIIIIIIGLFLLGYSTGKCQKAIKSTAEKGTVLVKMPNKNVSSKYSALHVSKLHLEGVQNE
ncbi:hypothetical protein AGIG_G14046 [Arapaima gigas]